MSFIYLWQNREKPNIFSKAWVKQWTKRILSLPNLIEISNIQLLLRIAGAKIGDMSIIASKHKIEGSLEKLVIGRCTLVAQVHIALHANVTIGNFVVINDGVKLLTASHDTLDPSWSSFAKPITIDDYAWVATDAIILPGVNIGRGAVIGAGAVVSKNIPAYGIAVGNPAKLVEKQRVKQLNYNPVQLVACYGAWLGKPSKCCH